MSVTLEVSKQEQRSCIVSWGTDRQTQGKSLTWHLPIVGCQEARQTDFLLHWLRHFWYRLPFESVFLYFRYHIQLVSCAYQTFKSMPWVTAKSHYNNLSFEKSVSEKNGTDVWPYSSKTMNTRAKLLFIKSKWIVERIKMRYVFSIVRLCSSKIARDIFWILVKKMASQENSSIFKNSGFCQKIFFDVSIHISDNFWATETYNTSFYSS